MGKETWVGYSAGSPALPKLRESILAPNGNYRKAQPTLSVESLQMLDYWYARDYDPFQDLSIILKNYRYLGGEATPSGTVSL